MRKEMLASYYKYLSEGKPVFIIDGGLIIPEKKGIYSGMFMIVKNTVDPNKKEAALLEYMSGLGYNTVAVKGGIDGKKEIEKYLNIEEPF